MDMQFYRPGHCHTTDNKKVLALDQSDRSRLLTISETSRTGLDRTGLDWTGLDSGPNRLDVSTDEPHERPDSIRSHPSNGQCDTDNLLEAIDSV